MARAARGWELRATHTHLYPGARLAADDGFAPARGDRVLVVFADHGSAQAAVRAVDADGFELTVAAHVTQRGAAIVAKHWRLEPLPGTGGWRVARRLAAERAAR